jgi:hypothetical protein
MMEQIVTVSPLDFSFPAFDILGIRILRHHNRLKQQTLVGAGHPLLGGARGGFPSNLVSNATHNG